MIVISRTNRSLCFLMESCVTLMLLAGLLMALNPPVSAQTSQDKAVAEADKAKSTSRVVDEWQNLKRLPAGQKLEVTGAGRQKRTVKLLEATDSGLRVLFNGSELTIARGDIEKVTRIDSRMMRRLLIGLAIGGSGGAVGGAVVGSKWDRNEGGGFGTWTGIVAAAGAGGGAGIGALLGLIPKRTVVYERVAPVRKTVSLDAITKIPD
jgi:hypothetical protein